MNPSIPGKRIYQLLEELRASSSREFTDELIRLIRGIRYASNTNEVFQFYFPIVCHILYFKPEHEKDLIGYIIGPSFANGTTSAAEMMDLIPDAMRYIQKSDPNFMTQEGQHWVENTWPTLKNAVEQEIMALWKDLEDMD
ncbi:MAG: hypothetical protein IPL65_17695 [Lewinellaceae bacterium]|nr:hypothetical protein [Lewinellaceae bacterium]